jgi:hypothetical protein
MSAVHAAENNPQVPPAPDIAGLPSWVVGVCGVAAVASLLFTALLFLNL